VLYKEVVNSFVIYLQLVALLLWYCFICVGFNSSYNIQRVVCQLMLVLSWRRRYKRRGRTTSWNLSDQPNGSVWSVLGLPAPMLRLATSLSF